MSETDDTDDLLLIPPDLFSVDNNLEQPYYNIVDSLIQQVTNLQNRIENIESTSDISLVGSFLDSSVDLVQNLTNMNKYNSVDDLYQPLSTQSTPQKPRTKFKLNSLPGSPNTRSISMSPKKFSAREKSQKKTDETMLSQIDSFLSKVKTIQRINTSRNLQGDFNDCPKHEGGLKSDISEFEKRNHKSEIVSEPVMTKQKTWTCGDGIKNVADHKAGKVSNNIDPDLKESKAPVSLNSTPADLSNAFDRSSDSSSESTQLTAYNRYKNQGASGFMETPLHSNALKVLNMHKKLLEDSEKRINEDHKEKVQTLNDNYGMLSLRDIWNREQGITSEKVIQKLQEEKLRREHCEQLIHELQTKNLELQQKLAVAIKVDQSKNNTIEQFRETLEKFAFKMEKVNKDNNFWEMEVSKIKKKHCIEMEEASKKISYYENEASKALNLAHNNQDKLSSLEKRCMDLQAEIGVIESQFNEMQDNYHKEFEKNKQLSEILTAKEIELRENRTTLNHSRDEVAQSKRAVEMCQAEFTSLKNECSKLRSELKAGKEACANLNDQKKKLFEEIETRKNNEKVLQEDSNKLKKQLESNKVELRNYYQGQVEILVQNKLKEFQKQLDQAEGDFKEEMKKRELSIAKTAATHIQQISEKYSLEIKLLEEKHAEEIRLYRIQISRYHQEMEILQNKLEKMQGKRVIVAQQLQKIMENQWNEALKIIANTKSPTSFNEQGFSTIDQLNSLKSRSCTNVEEVLLQHEEHTNGPKTGPPEPSREFQHFPIETPVTSKPHNFHEEDINRYINFFLNRQSNGEGQQSNGEEEKANSDRAAWRQGDRESFLKEEGGSRAGHRERRYGKPPWK